jgi:hypothetical protein
MGPCTVSISNKMQRYTVYLYLETALHVSYGTSTHLQEHIQLYLQHLVFVTPLLLSASIVQELEPVWVCCGWRTPPAISFCKVDNPQDLNLRNSCLAVVTIYLRLQPCFILRSAWCWAKVRSIRCHFHSLWLLTSRRYDVDCTVAHTVNSHTALLAYGNVLWKL